MITVNGDWFALETANTGYYLGVRGGLVENLHYGARVRVENSVPLREKTDIGYGGDVVYRAESAPVSEDARPDIKRRLSIQSGHYHLFAGGR